jgi:uncharacterized membrane protein (DUF2068 family)
VASARRDLGIRLIIAYKAVKAIGQFALAAGLVALSASGRLEAVRSLAEVLRADVTSRWSLLVGRALVALTSRHGLHLVELGLVVDGALTSVEGWALWRGFRWAPWLVVLATATPLPLEVLEIVRKHSAPRVAALLVNLAVVWYLARRIARTHGPPSPPALAADLHRPR